MRQYGNMRFAQLTVFVAMTAGLLSLVTRIDSTIHVCVIHLGGIFISIIFWIMEERAADYWCTGTGSEQSR